MPYLARVNAHIADDIQSLNNVAALIGEAACVYFVDKIGRRPPLIVGNAVSGMTFVVGA